MTVFFIQILQEEFQSILNQVEAEARKMVVEPQTIPTRVRKRQTTGVLHDLVSLQSFDGSFMLKDPLCAIIGKPLPDLQAGKNNSKGHVPISHSLWVYYDDLSLSL